MIGSRVLFGQERANLLVLETLKAQGCEILAVVEDHPSFRTIPRELEKRGIPYLEAPTIGRRIDGYLFDFLIGNPVRYFRLRKLLRPAVRSFQPTHIHVPNPFAFLMANAIGRPDLPIIYRVGDRPAKHNALWRWIWRRITRRVTHFVAISHFIVSELSALGVPRHKISLIYNKPPARLFPPTPDKSSDRTHILFIGQLSEAKGVDRLIEAFRIILPDFPDARLTIVGRIAEWSGDDWQRMLRDETLSDPLIGSRVFFPGEKEDIFHYLASAAFLAVPSVSQEPLSNVVGEAKAAARPSVVFPSGGLPELIRHGEDGFICHDTSIEALSEGLRYYLSDADRTREHGRKALASLSRLEIDQFENLWRAVYLKSFSTGSSTNISKVEDTK